MIGDRKKILNNKGFSLAEILIAISIFATIILISIEMFQSVLKGQFSAIASQNVQESMRFSFEVMSKEIRSAEGFHSGDTTCLTGPVFPIYKVFNTETGTDKGNELYLHNKNNQCVEYYLDSGRLMIKRGADALPITPDTIQVSDLQFFVNDDKVNEFHSKQASVTIYLEAMDTLRAGFSEKVKMQTTISSRYYE